MSVAKALLELGQELRRKGRRAVEQPHGVVGVVGLCLVLRQYRHHHADEVDHRGLRLAHLPPEPRRAEAVNEDERGPGGQRAHRRVILDVGVVEGQAGEEAVVGCGLRPVPEALPGGGVHPVGDHHALGVARRAGGVDQHGHVVGRHIRPLGQRRGGVKGFAERRPASLFTPTPALPRQGGGRFLFVPPQDTMPDAGGQVGGGSGHLGQRRVGDQRHGPGVVQDVGRLVAAVGGVDGNADSPQLRQPEPAVQVLDAVGHEQAHPVAVLDAHLAEHGRRPQHPVPHIAVGVGRAADLDERLVRVCAGDAVKHLADGGVPGQRRAGVSDGLLCAHVRPPSSVSMVKLPRGYGAVNRRELRLP